jgi:predicted regulator of Ras-like GTPase activity (Roadblock/LC7/MglB family)
MTVDPAVLEELNRLRGKVPELSGSVLATTDGLVVAHDAQGIEPDGLAALAAAHLALARRFAHAVNHGQLRESVVECDRGYITTYTAGPNALLTLVTSGDANLAMVHLEAPGDPHPDRPADAAGKAHTHGNAPHERPPPPGGGVSRTVPGPPVGAPAPSRTTHASMPGKRPPRRSRSTPQASRETGSAAGGPPSHR